MICRLSLGSTLGISGLLFAMIPLANADSEADSRKQKPVIAVLKKAEHFSQTYCGIDSAYLFLSICSHSKKLDMGNFERRFTLGKKGCSVNSIVDVLHSFGINVSVYQKANNNVSELPTPAILHVNNDHYIVLLSNEDKVTLFDNSIGVFTCTAADFSKIYKWEGIYVAQNDPLVSILFYGLLALASLGLGFLVLPYAWNRYLRTNKQLECHGDK